MKRSVTIVNGDMLRTRAVDEGSVDLAVTSLPHRVGFLAQPVRAEFMEWTNGLWTFPGERTSRIGHPAPFPRLARKRISAAAGPKAGP